MPQDFSPGIVLSGPLKLSVWPHAPAARRSLCRWSAERIPAFLAGSSPKWVRRSQPRLRSSSLPYPAPRQSHNARPLTFSGRIRTSWTGYICGPRRYDHRPEASHHVCCPFRRPHPEGSGSVGRRRMERCWESHTDWLKERMKTLYCQFIYPSTLVEYRKKTIRWWVISLSLRR